MLDHATSIDNLLRQLHLELKQLPYLVDMLADEPAEVQDVWHWRWETLMEWTEHLCQMRRDGSLTESQEHEFNAVIRLLVKNRPSIEQCLGCRLPREIDQPAEAGAVDRAGRPPDLQPVEEPENTASP